MSTPPSPARLVGYFAKKAPVCIITRRGPSRQTQLIVWNTDTDEFIPGQWFNGKVDRATITSDGKYMVIAIMGTHCHKHWDRSWGQVTIICRPPYARAIELWARGLCITAVGFQPDDSLADGGSEEHEVFSKTPCPFERAPGSRFSVLEHDYVLDASKGWVSGYDQRQRRITFEEGCVYVEDPDKRLLYDSNPSQPGKMLDIPEWARDW